MEADSELAGGTNLFWRSCPVLVRRGDRGEERTTELTIRLIATGQKHGQRVLRLFLSSESDPYFLQLLEVGEEEYALLRQDQGIRVDFPNFPGKLIGLLDKCIACKAEDLPRFQAVLSVGGGGAAGQGSLRVVENNDFKQLPHITLALRPGSDAAVKQWLAFRLGELRGDAGQLSQELERTQASRGSERNSLQSSLAEVRRAAAEAREWHDRLSLEWQADGKARETAVLEAKSRELAELREAGQRRAPERAELEAKYREALEASQARAIDLEGEARGLREHKYGLDGRVSELSAKLGAAEGSNRRGGAGGGRLSLTEEVERLRASSTALGRAKAERDVELGEALTKARTLCHARAAVAALEDKVAGQQQLGAEQAQRLRDMEADLQAQRDKVRRKAAIVARQEEELAARDRAADEAGQRCRGLQRELERATEDAEALRKEVGDMRGRLEESRAAAASNEQMIRWLNNQITETQLHYGGGAGAGLLAGRYSFRPGPPPAGAGATGPSGAAVGTAGAAAAPAGAAMGAAGGGGVGGGSGLAGARPAAAPSTYRTPLVPGASGSAAAAAGSAAARHAPASTSPASLPGSMGGGGGSVPTRGPFRSSFYATHFGGGASGQPPSASPAASTATTAGSLNLGASGAASQAGGGAAGAGAGAGGAPAAAEPAAAPAPAPAAAKHLGSHFEAPTFRMADTAAGRVPVPVVTSSAS
ncbi:hypothetical protein CHLNCDRAFT_143927 [Chlorella variabilis]|uniref:Spindle assembly abnormal protein 6 N-terminal domain-containing protein n=1 Tax=Chlorella variabilis TaxID=554065 RepID=E1ZAR7_CHLVA|nr:hypothetical protein CHLNCDRAFT_143927 [Chlorella variabilis]EFN57105.1 hypothetical protein CHLNCDRAFT_143927 [Chlorella variabilis]|eukprot:XP_005849207.1 hypothetical protein CHLNCDRAFT_143927 [Chlorella variabilis]